MTVSRRPRSAPGRRNLAGEITHQLRQAIVAGEFKPGAALAEPVLAERFNASRAPVREALIALEREGLLEFNERSRTRVRQLTAEDFEEICSMRIALESLAARHAATRWNEAHTRAVEENLSRQETAATLGELSHLDVELHELIVRLSGHRRLLSTWLGLRGQFEMWLAHTHRLQEKLAFEPRQVTVNSHRRMLSALVSGKPKIAADAMVAHIELWREWLPVAFPQHKASAQPTEASHNGHNGFARKAAVVALAALAFILPVRAETAPEQFAFFESKIRPLLVEQCYECHSATAKKLKGALRLDSRADLLKGGDSGPAVVPGDPGKSLLLRAVRHEVEDLAMPPKKPKLAEAVIADLAKWVKMGAPFPEATAKRVVEKPHWAFQTVQHPAPPKVKNKSWPRTSVDYFIASAFEKRGLQPAALADKRTLLRRATYDLTGLPPTPEEMEDFEKDTSAKAFAKVVDRLLASPHYGERWGRHWLDLVRYADTAGETADYPVPVAWRYRNYIIDAFNADKPYDEFLREQIAGDIMARQGPRERYAERTTATGYLAISRRFGFDSENYHHLTIQDTIDTLGQNVLGLSLGCARCHNHKFDPVSMSDYYALFGIFDSSSYAFPGSEQKQKSRVMVPLLPPSESQPKWREFDARVAALGRKLEQQKQPVPGAVLRSLDNLDGDFEIQAPAAGGSNGVLVPPWLWEGKIGVANAAQSPFKNLYPLGKAGASVAGGTNEYRLAQGLYPRRTRENCRVLHVNLDFRAGPPEAGGKGRHRFWIGSRADGQGESPAIEVLISADNLSLRTGDKTESIGPLKPNQWHNLQLTFDLESRTISGSVGWTEGVTSFSKKPLSPGWSGTIDFAGLDSRGAMGGTFSAIDYDNFGAQDFPIPAVSTTLPALAGAGNQPEPAALTEQLQKLAGIEGDFELQSNGATPAMPWGPGPNSVVKISTSAQSPHRNLFAAGELGIHMPNRGEYDGFGQTLAGVKPNPDGHLFASFDFRCASKDAGGDGSWRYYLGHGPGNSAAVELFFNGREFFRRSADARETVCPLRIGEWYQVQLKLDLKAKKYTGVIASLAGRIEFTGQLASGWDGTIDYTFIDSYGHLGGVRPALDADNFVISETALPPLDAAPVQVTDAARGARRAQAMAIRQQLAALQTDAEKARQELNQLLADGPGEMTYGVVEGTPHNARLQMRGEPDRPGDEVPRGFIKVLGGASLPSGTPGSGRLELAQWLTRPTNPLTARVMVNRIWQYHFGRGLVKTPNDFGVRGQAPTHPELLDHLATEFVKNGWSVKAMHRLVMLSATYQESSVAADVRRLTSPVGKRDQSLLTSAATDESDYYTSFPRRRLSAEELRDSILAISGELDRKPAQEHPFPSPISWGYSQHGPFSAVYDHNQRSVYLMTQRLRRHPFLGLFDGADPNASTAERRTTTVPTQALFFLNDPFVHAKAEKFAARLHATQPNETARIELACRLTLGRAPTEIERAEAAEFLAAYRGELAAAGKDLVEARALAAYVRALFGANEFLHVD